MNAFKVSDLAGFARAEFGGVDLGDARLDRRLISLVQGLAADPSRSIPQALGDWSEVKAAYRFFAHEGVTREKVLEPHYQATAERIRDAGDVLVIQDTCFLNFTHHPATDGLGNIGSKSQPNQLRGVLVHSSLVVTPESHESLGVLDQQVIVREGYQSAGQSSKTLRRRERESAKWLAGVRSAASRTQQAGRLIFVFDREGDVFEAFEQIRGVGARFVIRASSNRRLELIEDSDGDRTYLFASLAKAAVVGRMEVDVPTGNGHKARMANLTLRSGTYSILPPADRKRRGEACEVNALLVIEENPPQGEKPLEWRLLTSEKVDTLQAAERVARMYRGRWKIEELHKGLKTGCNIEARQLEHWERLDVLLGVFSVIAWRLLVLRDAARAQHPCPIEALSAEDCAILRRLNPKLRQDSTSREYLRAIAKLGGFLGRKSDGDPGWITLWKGYTRLCDMRIGYVAARR